MAAVILFLIAACAEAAVTSVSLATTWFDAKNNSVTDTRVIGTREANVRHVIGRSSEGGFEIVLGGSGTYTIAKQYTGSGCTDGTVATGAHNAHVLNRLSGTVGTDRVFIKPVQKAGDTDPTETFTCTINLTISDDTPSDVDYTFLFNWSFERRVATYQTNFFRRPDSAQNCTKFSTWEDVRGNCTITSPWPSIDETPVGGKRIDDVTGAWVQRVTPFGTKHLYTSKTVNVDGSLVGIKFVFPIGSTTPQTGIYSTSDYSRKNAKFTGFFSPTNPNVWWNTKSDDGGSGANEKEIHKYEYDGGTGVTETTVLTWGVTNEVLRSNDNSQNIGSIFPFWSQNTVTGERGSLCVTDGNSTLFPITSPVCYDFGNHPFGRPDGTETNGNVAYVAGPDKDGYHYVVYYGVWDTGSSYPTINKASAMIFYAKLGTDTELTLLPFTAYGIARPEDPCCSVPTPYDKATWGLFPGPNGENAYYSAGGHSSATCDGSGDCWWFGTAPLGVVPGKDSGNASQFPGARNLTVMREAYQGTSYTHNGLELGGPWTRVGTFDEPDYYNCAFQAQQVCVISEFGGSRTTYKISNATVSMGVMTLTMTTNWGTSYAQPAWTAGVTEVSTFDIGGVSNANATFTVQSVTGNVITVNCGSCSGTYTSGGFIQERVASTTKTSANTDILQAVRWGGRDFGAFHYRILAMNHMVYATGDSGAELGFGPVYDLAYPFGVMSGDGKWAFWGDNEGIGNHTSVFKVPTGFDIDSTTPINHFDRHGRGFEINGRTLTLHRTRGHCTVEYGTNRDRTALTPVQMPPGMTQAKLTMTGGTKYYFWAVCDNFDVSVKSVTAASLPGSGTTDVAVSGRAPVGATKMVVQYGDTAAFGSGAEVACSAGSTCTATVTGNNTAGAVYYGVTWARADNVVVKREPTRIVSVP